MLTGLKALLSTARDKGKPAEGQRSPRDETSQQHRRGEVNWSGAGRTPREERGEGGKKN